MTAKNGQLTANIEALNSENDALRSKSDEREKEAAD
jgi:hypothetical protein